MDKMYACYCGLYCEFCAVKAKIEPAAKVLYDEMKAAGFEDIIKFLPSGEEFWSFLKGMTNKGICFSCKDGGGNPDCAIRICAKDKGVEMCALCEDYPCEKINAFLKSTVAYDVLEHDNALLRDKGWEAWGKLQDERKANGFIYEEEKPPQEIKSRCGILCDTAKCKEAYGVDCAGCVAMDKPFWGESCPVKSCCEGKNHEHCGQCADFPCELLNQFAYDKEQGDDGERIEQCRRWAAKI